MTSVATSETGTTKAKKSAKRPTAEQARKKLQALGWSSTNKDFRGQVDGRKSIMRAIGGQGTCLVSFESLSDIELMSMLNTASRLEYQAFLFGLPRPIYPAGFCFDKKATWKKSGLSGESRVVACNGEAHSNPHIDNCTLCMPRWGDLKIPVEFKTLKEVRNWASANRAYISHCWTCNSSVKPSLQLAESGKFFVKCPCGTQTCEQSVAYDALEAWEDARELHRKSF